jgi:hypothetical protein
MLEGRDGDEEKVVKYWRGKEDFETIMVSFMM